MSTPSSSSSRLSCRPARFGVAVALAVTTMLSGCFTSTGDFKSKAEKSITDDVAAEVGVTFTDVNCDTPIDQNAGTRFACQAIDADGGIWEFDNVIDAKNSLVVNIARRP